jgi:hypothetical protein
MNQLKLCLATLFFCTMVLLTSCRTRGVHPPASPPPAEITQRQYLFEIARQLGRWQLNDAEIRKLYQNQSVVFWVEPLHPPLDAGDDSLYAEIYLPQLGIGVKLKKADYRIEEFNAAVKSRSFRIIEVSRGNVPARRPENAVEVKVPLPDLRGYLFTTRNLRDYPDAALIEHLRAAARAEIGKELNLSTNAPTTDQTIFLAPLSPVANDLWVFWEDRCLLFHFASDIDLSDNAVWEHEPLMVRVFDINQQMVISHEQAPGSNRFLTRSQIGRVLYNCIVLGQKITLKPIGSSPAGTGQTPPKSR